MSVNDTYFPGVATGGGQAGLSASYSLRERLIRHVVLGPRLRGVVGGHGPLRQEHRRVRRFRAGAGHVDHYVTGRDIDLRGFAAEGMRL